MLLLIRHGLAEDRRPGLADAARALTDEGRARFSGEVRGLSRLEVRLDRVFHSPWARAAQTAALLAPVLTGELEETALLARSPGPALIAALAAGKHVAAVGHEPWMSALLSILVSGTVSLADRLPFKKGGVAWLDGDPEPGRMTLVALLPPRVLRALGSPSEIG